MIRITTEDISGADFSRHPAEMEITTFGARAVSDLAVNVIPRESLNDIARAIVDQGWRYGVRSAEIHMTRDGRTTRMKVGLTYA